MLHFQMANGAQAILNLFAHRANGSLLSVPLLTKKKKKVIRLPKD
jgi:hypothetical protein